MSDRTDLNQRTYGAGLRAVQTQTFLLLYQHYNREECTVSIDEHPELCGHAS